MKPDERFLKQPKHFWANVRSISQQLGYTDRESGGIKIPTLADIRIALDAIGLDDGHLVNPNDTATQLGSILLAYYQHRASVLNTYVLSLMSL